MLGAPKENDYREPVHRLRKLDRWLPHIKNIGCNAIYIGPLFESVGHGYETTDYKKLDSRLGDNDDLKAFVRKCHSMGIRVIFDGVFNHTGRDFFAFKDLKANRENSRYRDWYCNVNFWGNNEYNDGFSYQNWGGYNLLVKLNQRNPEVKDYICDVIRYWVSEFDVDGIRLDAADVLDFDFMKTLRYVADNVKPEFWLMGEVIHGEYNRWVNEGTLHSVTNYHLHKALYSGVNDHNNFEIAHTVKRLYGMGGNRPDGLKLYNFTDNHDVERIMTKLINKANYVPVHIMLYTLPGIPSIYYGSEFGIEGRKERYSDASLRPELKYEDYEHAAEENACVKLISCLGRARQAVPALSYGDYREVMLNTKQYLYTRTSGDSMAIIGVNNDENDGKVCGSGIFDGDYISVLTGKKHTVSGGYFEAVLPANSGDIWVPAWYEDKLGKPVKNEPIAEFKPETEATGLNRTSGSEAASDLKTYSAAELNCKTESAVKTSETCAAAASKASDTSDSHEQPSACTSSNTPQGKAEKKENPEIKAGVSVQGKAPQTAAADTKERSGAGAKYGLDRTYDSLDPDEISRRSDYDSMSIEELQVAILEKMAKNGPVNSQMVKTVTDNVYPDSLRNWVKSFR